MNTGELSHSPDPDSTENRYAVELIQQIALNSSCFSSCSFYNKGMSEQESSSNMPKILSFPDQQSPEVLGKSLDDSIRRSNVFSYMGVLFGNDYLGRPVSKLYLQQKTPTPCLPPEHQQGIVEVISSFNTFASEMEKHMRLYLHLIEPTESDDWLEMELRRIERESQLQLVHSERFDNTPESDAVGEIVFFRN